MSYQYWSYLYYRDIHLHIHICCYCSLTYDYIVIFITFYFKLSGTMIFSQILNLFICGIFEPTLLLQQCYFYYIWFLIINNQATTERRRTIRCQLIFVREILTQTWTAWFQVIFENILLYPVSVSYWVGPDCGIFCILIVDIILRSSLLDFSLLRAINYHCNKGPICYVLPLYIQFCYGELSIFFLVLLSQDTPAYTYLMILFIDLQIYCYFDHILL